MENSFIDPLDYFNQTPHIIDYILSHLSVHELLKAALINSSYYKFVIDSEIYRRKVKLKISRNLIKSNELGSFERSYRNIKINLNFNCDEKFFNFLQTLEDVKFLELSNGVLSSAEFRMIIESFNKLEDLILDDIIFEDLNLNEIRDLKNLGNLKSIEIKSIPEYLVHPLLVQCKKLKRLSVKQLSRKAPFDELLKLLASEVQFQLEEFKISDYGYYNFDHQKLGLLSFLHKSFQTLKILEFDVWIGILPLKLVFQMPQLEKLRLYEIAHADRTIVWDEIEMPQSHTLKCLNIQDYSHNEKLLTCILEAAPKIHLLEVYSLSHTDIQQISTLCSDLKELHAYFLDINNDNSIFQKNLLENLHKCNVAVGDDLKEIIMNRSEAERSHLEKLLLAN